MDGEGNPGGAAEEGAGVTRIAACGCGKVTAACEGEPVRVSVCHCLNCQRRSGSAFAAQARFPVERVTIAGETRVWELNGDSGGRARFRFCTNCGATIAYTNEGMDDLIAIPLGAFADPDFPSPHYSVYETRQHRWVAIVGEGIERYD